MNFGAVCRIMGKIFLTMAVFFALPLIISIIYHENITYAYLIPMAVMLALGIPMQHIPEKDTGVYIGEGFLIVSSAWVLISVFSAVPFVITGAIPSVIDAFFEMVSGFTTTGSTILTDIEALPHSLLFWRSFTHWIGGMGVLVFMLAVTSNKDTKTMYIMRAETPGPKADKLVSKTKYTAQILYALYFGLTVLEIMVLMIGRLPLFDAVVTAFSTAGTGGFAIKNASIAAYNSKFIEYTVSVFMLLFGVNFGLYFLLMRRKFKDALKNEELRWFLIIVLLSTMLIAFNISGVTKNAEEAFRYAFFTVSSTISTTGFVCVDYEIWPTASKIIILLLMFVGGCSSSTGGGIKVIRIAIMAKIGMRELKHASSPRTVKNIMFSGKNVEHTVVSGISAYIIIYLFVVALSMILVSFDNVSMVECISGVITCLNNVGPGFGSIGAVGNFSALSGLTKIVLCIDMLLGRLELFPILALLSRSVWKV